MSRFLNYAAPLLGCLALGLAAIPAHAQVLYVGYDNASDFTTPGFAAINSTGATASGNWSIVANTSPVESTFSYQQVQAYNTSQVTITGGTFGSLLSSGNSTINLVGTNLAESSAYQVSPDGIPFYTVTGYFAGSATLFTLDYGYDTSTETGPVALEFNGAPAVPGAAPVPEASTTVSLGLLLLGGGAWALLKRRKTA